MSINIGSLVAHIGLNTRGLRRDVADAKRQIDQMAHNGTRSLGLLTRSISMGTAAIGAFVGARGLGAVISTGAQFQSSITRAGAVMQATEAEMRRLSETAREMGATTRYSATESASALGFLGMAGLMLLNLWRHYQG